MAKGPVRRQNSAVLKLEAVARIGNIPIVESGIKTAENVYGRLKKSSSFINWSCDKAEYVIQSAFDSVKPAVQLMEGPIHRLDALMCKSLDIVEKNVPYVCLPPQMMISNTKEYMSDHLVKPVLQRAESVKKMGVAVLDSKVTSYAAERIDGALDAADKYVDKYLPSETDENNDDASSNHKDEAELKAVQVYHHGQRFSKKLKRRLTERTIIEAKALQNHSKKTVHIVLYAIELILTEPRLAMKKASEQWQLLSKDEPENQARPQNVEELIVLVTRESARKFVHLINYTTKKAGVTKQNIQNFHISPRTIYDYSLHTTNRLIEVAHLEKVRDKILAEIQALRGRAHSYYEHLQNYTTNYLERLATFLSGRLEAEKISSSPSNRRIPTLNNPSQNNINGIY